MIRIQWRDPAKRRVSYAGFRFDGEGVSTKAWAKRTDLRLKRFFNLNQHRQWFEVVEVAPPGAGVTPAPEAPEVHEDDNPNQDECCGRGAGAEGVGEEVPAVGAEGVRRLGEEDGDDSQESDAALESKPVEEVHTRLRHDEEEKPRRVYRRSGKARDLR